MPPAPAWKPLPPIMRTLVKIFVLTILVSCNQRQVIPRHTDTFKTVDKSTGDTIKFYGFTDIDSAIFYAKKDKQNILVVFGGYTIEKNWETLKYYNNPDFINSNFKIVWLPVDSRRIAKDTNTVVKFNDKEWRLRTVGDNNYYFQINSFKYSNQPFYCFIDSLKMPLGQTIGYEKDKKTITDFLNSGLTK
jgi:hypothetical protein